MPFYRNIDPQTEAGRRTCERLLALRSALNQVPQKTIDDKLLLATWNIREFDSNAYGERSDEAMLYIAEIISRFDIVAVQEVRRDLRALERLRSLLGHWWDYVVTDVSEGKAGNDERLAFLYDSRKVKFSGIAGEVVIPPKTISVPGGKKTYEPSNQLVRSPYLVGFQAGWSRFMLATVHILYGDSTADNAARQREIEMIAQFLKGRANDESDWTRNIILLGDFNIFKPSDVSFEAITDAGFVIPEKLQTLPSNAPQTKHYDQIAFFLDDQRLLPTGKSGVFDYFAHVYREQDERLYAEEMGESYRTSSGGKPRSESSMSNYYKSYWRTHQMSDHLPMWVELRIDFANEYLERKLDQTVPVEENLTKVLTPQSAKIAAKIPEPVKPVTHGEPVRTHRSFFNWFGRKPHTA